MAAGNCKLGLTWGIASGDFSSLLGADASAAEEDSAERQARQVLHDCMVATRPQRAYSFFRLMTSRTSMRLQAECAAHPWPHVYLPVALPARSCGTYLVVHNCTSALASLCDWPPPKLTSHSRVHVCLASSQRPRSAAHPRTAYPLLDPSSG